MVVPVNDFLKLEFAALIYVLLFSVHGCCFVCCCFCFSKSVGLLSAEVMYYLRQNCFSFRIIVNNDLTYRTVSQ